MGEELKDLKKVLSAITIGLILIFVAFLALEAGVLIYKAPYISDSIMSGELGPGSDIILPEDEVNTSGGLKFSISPDVNGSFEEYGGYFIFIPDRPLSPGSKYTMKYGEGHSMSFYVLNGSLKAEVIYADSGVIFVSFNKDVIKADAESLIRFTPYMDYGTTWYGNTLAISPNASMNEIYDFRMAGTVNTTDGKNGTIDIDMKYTYYPVGGDTDRIPHLPSTVVFIMLPPGLIVGTDVLSGIGYLRYFQFVFVTIIVSIAYGIYVDHRAFVRRLREDTESWDISIPSDSVFFEIGALLMATISFSLISYYIVYLTNNNPTVPSMDENALWENMYSLARAGVWEEIITRIPFLGLPLLAAHYLMKRKKAPVWRYVLGGGFEMDGPALFFLFMSSLFFGLAHAFGGWDFFKVLPAMVGGLAMGYLFLKWGLYASIILHFSNDYISIPAEIFPSLDTATGLLVISMVVIGIFTFYLYLKAFLLKFVFPRATPASESDLLWYVERNESEPSVSQSPPVHEANPEKYPPVSGSNIPEPTGISISPSGYIRYNADTKELPVAPYPFVCRICGGTTASFMSDGKVICMGCGMEYVLGTPSDVRAGDEEPDTKKDEKRDF